MDRPRRLIYNIDWFTILLYLALVGMGLACIYSVDYDENNKNLFNFSKEHGKQVLWIGTAFLIAFLIMLIDSKFFTSFAFVIYGLTILLLIGVLLFGKEVNNSRSWFEFGGIRLQPAEFAKFSTNLALANMMSRHNFRVMEWKNLLLVGVLLAIPAGLILLQNDTGSALVYSSFIFVLFREGMHGSILFLCFAAIILFILSILIQPFSVLLVIIGCAALTFFYFRRSFPEFLKSIAILTGAFLLFYAINKLLKTDYSAYIIGLVVFALFSIVIVFWTLQKKIRRISVILLVAWLCIGFSASVDYLFERLLPHQQDRINELLGVETNPSGSGYNVTQSKIAIGSGGLTGKGFLEGPQTQNNFVPIQSTDFIFSNIGEEWGFVGSTLVILLFMTFILRIIALAERQRSTFSRVYGYGVASILFFHVLINIGMTIGLAPVIGIPLPFFSYGGSSLWAFTILIFIFLRLDANRLQVFR